MKPSRYNIEKNDGEFTYVYNTLHGTFLKILSSMWENIGKTGGDDFSTLYPSFFAEDDVDEFDVYRYRYYCSAFDNQIVNLVIAPTMNCNFACAYCFEKEEHKRGSKMDEKVEDAIVRYLEENRDKKIHIKWFGGEPLLAFDVMQSISWKLTGKGIVFDAIIATNGSLFNDEIIAQLDSLNIKKVNITLGGVGKMHDERRVSKNRKPTFDLIIDSIEKIINRTQAQISISVLVDKSNLSAYEDVCNYLSRRFGEYMDTRILLWYNHVRNMTDFQGAEVCFNGNDKFQYLERLLSNNNGINALKPCIPRKMNACQYHLENGFAVDPAGDVYKCQEQFGYKEFVIGNIMKNNLKESCHAKAIFSNSAFDDPECCECNLLPSCGGGCPYERNRKKGEKEKSYCSLYKFGLSGILPKMYKAHANDE